MTFELQPYRNIEVITTVDMYFDQIANTSTFFSGLYRWDNIYFSDYTRDIYQDVIDYTQDPPAPLHKTYKGLGKFMNITDTASNIRAADSSVTITLSGIPTQSLEEVMQTEFIGRRVNVQRAVITPTFGEKITELTGLFNGYITNFTLDEQYDSKGRVASNFISFECTSLIGVLNTLTTGRRTNPIDQKRWFPTDGSMNRVPNLANNIYNFGVKK